MDVNIAVARKADSHMAEWHGRNDFFKRPGVVHTLTDHQQEIYSKEVEDPR